MKTVAQLLLKLYPKAWRVRYREEMSDLLDNHRVTCHTVMDLMIGAMKAQLFWERTGLWRIQFMLGCALLSMVCLLGYAVIQQDMRRGANFPQQTIVHQAATAIASGASFHVPEGTVNVKSSLSPFVIVYDNSGAVAESSVRLNGHTPALPVGVLDYTRGHGIDKITWQPTSGTRIAAVIEHYDGNGGGFVLSGRSLRVVENQETLLLRIVQWVWVGLLGTFSAFLYAFRRRRCASESS